MMRGGAGGTARLACFLVSIGLSFGFVSVVVAIAWASGFRLPDGVEPRDYVTLGRRGADSGLFGFVSSQDYERLLDSPTGISWASADFFRRPVEVRTAEGITRMAHSRRVSGNFFDLLGVQAAVGTLESDVVAAAVVTEAFAQSAYGSAADALGREVPGMFDQPVPVAGVADVAFKGIFDEPVDVWILEPVNPLGAASDGTVTITVTSSLVPVGVLDEGTTLAAAQNMLDGFRFEAGPGDYLGATERDHAELAEGIESLPDARRNVLERLGWLVLVVVLLLALASMAVFDFLLAAHYRREESDAVRLAIGATPGDVFRATLIRHGAWMAGTGVVGVLSFFYIGDVLLGLEPFAGYLGELTARQSLAGVTAGLSLLAAAFFLSACIVSRFVSRTSRVMSHAKRHNAVRPSRMARRALLVVATASLLLVASLGVRYAAESRVTLPFQHVDTMMFDVFGMEGEPITPEAVRRTLVAQPEVEAVARAEMLPLLAESIRPANRVMIRGAVGLEETVFLRNGVSPDFFETLGIAVIAGRPFDGVTQSEVTVSRAAAVRLAGEPGNAIGMALHLVPATPSEENAAGRVVTVVGVVGDVAYGSMADGDRSQPVIYGLAGQTDHQLWLVRHRGLDEDILEPFGDDAYRIGTLAEIFREQFLAVHSIEAALGAACAFALALSLVGVAMSIGRGIAAAGRHIGIYLSVGTTGIELTGRYSGEVLVDLVWAAVLVCAATTLARVLLPDATAAIELWLVVAVVPLLALACVAVVYQGIARFETGRSVSSLISGAHT